MDQETKEKLEDFLDEARRKLSIPQNLSTVQIKTHIVRFQEEILKFLDHSFSYLEDDNPNVDTSKIYFPRGKPNESTKDYLQRQNKKYLPGTRELLVAFHGDIKKNGYAISHIDSKAKHSKLNDLESKTEPVVSFSITNVFTKPDEHFIRQLPDGSTNIDGFVSLDPSVHNVRVSDSAITGPDGLAVIHDFRQSLESKIFIIFKDGTSLPLHEWATSCVLTCESIYERIRKLHA